MSEKLLPCPFCGAPADPPELYGESKTAMFVDCSKCGANVYHGTADKEANSAAVVVAWNRRASSQMGDEELREILAECVERASPKADRTALAIVAGEEIPGAAQITVKEALVAMSRVRASLPQPTAGSTGEGDSFISEALAWAENMRLAAVAGCNCGAKAHELSWHSVTCRFRALEEGAALLEEAASTPAQSPAHDEGHPHLIDGEFQSDKYPTIPRGKVPLSVKDKTAQDLLWTYAQRRRVVDGEFANDLELALTKHGFVPSTPALCEDEGCPHYGTAHVCVSTPAQSVLVEALHKISNPFDHGHCGTCGKECAGATDCDCSFPVWEQDNPIAIAKAALSHAPFQPAPVVESANVKLLREATLLLQNVEDSFPMNAELPGWLRDCRKRIEAIASSPQPDRESERDYEEIAGRIWDAWQNSPTCTDQWRGISWTNICQSRKTNAAAQACYETGMAEARAAFRFEFTSSNRPQATEEGK